MPLNADKAAENDCEKHKAFHVFFSGLLRLLRVQRLPLDVRTPLGHALLVRIDSDPFDS